jgi:putative PIG3 family NAD(P)H quinone oxidoreductase
MKAITLKEFGGPEVMQIGELPTPEPGEGQVLVRVMATSVNRADLIQRQGNYPPPPGESEILGLEAAGVIETIGTGVSGWKPGDRVMGLVAGGGYAQFVSMTAEHLLPVPEALDFVQAACVSETYITAFLNIFLIGGLQSGQTVLLHGGGGGVNTAAIQLCRQLVSDANVIVTASPGKLGRVRELGVDLVINYREQDFAAEVRSFTKKRGADVILDHIGARYLQPNLRCLAVEGRLVIIGLLGGSLAELNLGHLMVKRQRIIGSVLRSRSRQEKTQITAVFAKRVLPHFAKQEIRPLVHRVYPLAEARAAHEEMDAGRHFGKIALQVQAAT